MGHLFRTLVILVSLTLALPSIEGVINLYPPTTGLAQWFYDLTISTTDDTIIHLSAATYTGCTRGMELSRASPRKITIQGASKATSIIDCEDVLNNGFYLFVITSETELHDFTIMNWPSTYEPVFFTANTFTAYMDNIRIFDTTTAVRMLGSGVTVHVSNCEFEDTTYIGMLITDADVYVSNSLFKDNTGTFGAVLHHSGASSLVRLTDCTITEASWVNVGAVYTYNGARVELIRTDFTDIDASVSGTGTVSCSASTCIIDDCLFEDITLKYYGGVMNAFLGATFSMTNSIVRRVNTVHGGGVYAIEGSTGTVTGCQFVDVTVIGYGSGAHVHGVGTSVSLTDCSFTNGRADRGAVSSTSYGAVSLLRCNFTNNNATNNGGSLMSYGGTMTGHSLIVRGSRASLSGGFLAVQGANVTLTAVDLEVSTASVKGGAVYVHQSGRFTLNGLSTIHRGTAAHGGAVFTDGPSTFVTLNSVDITECTAVTGEGGAVGGTLATVSMTNVHIDQCSSALTGCGVKVYEAALTVDTSTIENCDKEALYASGSTTTVTITNSAFNTNAADYGAGVSIHSPAAVTISDSEFSANAAISGAALYITGASGPVAVSRCSFVDNIATSVGAAAYLTGSVGTMTSVVFDDVDFLDNSASAAGAAIYADAVAGLSVEDSWVEAHEADVGAGIFLKGATTVALIERTTFEGCEAVDAGGALYVDVGAEVTVTECVFTANVAGDGAAAYIITSEASFDTCTFTDSEVSRNGGSLLLTNFATATVSNSLFDGSSSSNSGGAIGLFFSSIVTVTASNFVSCEAAFNGGDICAWDISEVTLNQVNSTAARSVVPASGYGGSMYLVDGTSGTLTDVHVYNASSGDGGAITFNFAVFTITRSSFIACSASRTGGALYADVVSDITLVNSICANNSASNGGALSVFYSTLVWEGPSSQCTNNRVGAAGAGSCLHAYSNLVGQPLDVTLEAVAVTGNSGVYGGINFDGVAATGHLSDCTLTNNVGQSGAALRVMAGASVSVATSSVTGNIASGTGAVFVGATATVSLSSVSLVGNTGASGGAVHNLGHVTASVVTLDGNSISPYQANAGSALFLGGASQLLDQVTIVRGDPEAVVVSQNTTMTNTVVEASSHPLVRVLAHAHLSMDTVTFDDEPVPCTMSPPLAHQPTSFLPAAFEVGFGGSGSLTLTHAALGNRTIECRSTMMDVSLSHVSFDVLESVLTTLCPTVVDQGFLTYGTNTIELCPGVSTSETSYSSTSSSSSSSLSSSSSSSESSSSTSSSSSSSSESSSSTASSSSSSSESSSSTDSSSSSTSESSSSTSSSSSSTSESGSSNSSLFFPSSESGSSNSSLFISSSESGLINSSSSSSTSESTSTSSSSSATETTSTTGTPPAAVRRKQFSTGAAVGVSAGAVVGIGLIVVLLLIAVKKGTPSNKVEPYDAGGGGEELQSITTISDGEEGKTAEIVAM